MKCEITAEARKTLEYCLVVEGNSLVAKILILSFARKDKISGCGFQREEIKLGINNWLKNRQNCSCPLRSFCVDLVVYCEGEAFICSQCPCFKQEISLTEDIIEALPDYQERIEMIQKGLVKTESLKEEILDNIVCKISNQRKRKSPDKLWQTV